MPANFLLDSTIDNTRVPCRHFGRAISLKRAAILVALFVDCLRALNGRQRIRKASGPGASQRGGAYTHVRYARSRYELARAPRGIRR